MSSVMLTSSVVLCVFCAVYCVICCVVCCFFGCYAVLSSFFRVLRVVFCVLRVVFCVLCVFCLWCAVFACYVMCTSLTEYFTEWVLAPHVFSQALTMQHAALWNEKLWNHPLPESCEVFFFNNPTFHLYLSRFNWFPDNTLKRTDASTL